MQEATDGIATFDRKRLREAGARAFWFTCAVCGWVLPAPQPALTFEVAVERVQWHKANSRRKVQDTHTPVQKEDGQWKPALPILYSWGKLVNEQRVLSSPEA